MTNSLSDPGVWSGLRLYDTFPAVDVLLSTCNILYGSFRVWCGLNEVRTFSKTVVHVSSCGLTATSALSHVSLVLHAYAGILTCPKTGCYQYHTLKTI